MRVRGGAHQRARVRPGALPLGQHCLLQFQQPFLGTQPLPAAVAVQGAVGRAEATNPMPLVIPCHRVVGADGKLHGYGGGEGLPTKEWLLKLEGAVLA